jgi:nucleoside diphosphate kinase
MVFIMLESLIEPSFYTENNLYVDLLDLLKSQISEEDLLELKKLAFILIKPDAVISGKVNEILQFLYDRDIVVFELMTNLQTTSQQFEELYKFNLIQLNKLNMSGCWWLNSEIYMQCPSIILLVYDKQARNNDLQKTVHEKICTLKGPSNPLMCEPGQIRYDLNACNRAINLIHCSDDPLSTAREYLIFHPLNRLKKTLKEFRTLGSSKPTLIKFSYQQNGLGQTHSVIDFIHTLYQIKIRLLLVNRKMYGEGIFDQDTVSSIYQSYFNICECDENLASRLKKFFNMSLMEFNYLSKHKNLIKSDIDDILFKVSCPSKFKLGIALECIGILKKYNIFFTELEEIVLKTGMYYVIDYSHLL